MLALTHSWWLSPVEESRREQQSHAVWSHPPHMHPHHTGAAVRCIMPTDPSVCFCLDTGTPGPPVQITILRQEVVVKEMPPPEVVAPSNPQKPIDPAAAAAAALLARQRRCTLRVRQGQLPRLTELLFKAAQPRGKAAAAAAAAVGAAAVGAGVDGAAAEVSPRVTDDRAKEARQALKPSELNSENLRVFLGWCTAHACGGGAATR